MTTKINDDNYWVIISSTCCIRLLAANDRPLNGQNALYATVKIHRSTILFIDIHHITFRAVIGAQQVVFSGVGTQLHTKEQYRTRFSWNFNYSKSKINIIFHKIIMSY